MTARGSGEFDKVVAVFQPLRNDVYVALRRAILLQHLSPGDRVVEAELARQMQISRGPIRESLGQLEQEGYVEYRPRKGFYVTLLSAERALDQYTVRAELEGLAVRLATPRVTDADLAALQEHIDAMVGHARTGDADNLLLADVAFHELMCQLAGNPVLFKAWRALGPDSWTLFSGRQQDGHHPPTELATRHVPILDAIRGGDVEAAARAARDHILEVGRIVAAELSAKAIGDAPRSEVR